MLSSPPPFSSRSSAVVAGRGIGHARSARVDRPRRRRVAVALAIAVALLSGTALAIGTGPGARAAGSPAAAPSAEPERASGTPDPTLGAPTPTPGTAAPTVDPVGDRTSNAVTLGGTGASGATIRVLDPAVPSSSLCEARVPTSTTQSTGRWSCRATVANGADIVLTVRDTTHTALGDVSSASFSVLGAPTLRGGLLVGAKASGTAEAGAEVTVAATSGQSASATADANGQWTAVLDAGAFPSATYTLSATQRSSAVPAVERSGASAAVSATVDRDAPTAPAVTSPAAGAELAAQPVVFAGTGEDAATVTVYVDDSPICQATVADGSWRCDSTGSSFPIGDRRVQAGQVDAAGNFGPASAAVVVTVLGASSPSASPSGAPPVSPTPGATSAPAPADPDSGTDASPGDTTGGDESSAAPAPVAPGGGGSAGGGAAGGSPSGGAADGDDPTAVVRDTGTWATATSFGRDLPSLAQTFGGPVWPLAALLGLLFLVLIAGPVRLGAAALRGRVRPRARRLTGRNRTVEQPTSFSAGSIDPRLAVGLALAVGAAVIAVAAGVDDQVQYARLFAGIALGLILLNGLAVALPAVLVGRRLGLRARVRMSPGLLGLALVACAATRVLALDPPLVLGVLLTGTLVARAAAPSGTHVERAPDVDAGPREHGLAALVQLVALVVVPSAAWALHGTMTATGGFGWQLGRETLATVCLAGLGSLVLSLLPVGSLPGHAVLAWSTRAYVVVTVLGVTAAAVVFVGNPATAFPWTALVAAAVVAALFCVAAWLWVRVVEPARRVS